MMAACATTAKYESKLQTWVGADTNRLITAWGQPTSEYTLPNGNKQYTFVKSGGSRGFATVNGNFASSRVNEVYCKTVFTTNSRGVVESWHWEGNDCASE